MKWGSFFFLLTCLLMENLVSGEENDVKIKKTSSGVNFTCSNGIFWHRKQTLENVLDLPYKDIFNYYTCRGSNEQILLTLTVRIRTCDNCIELDPPSLSAVIVGNILATFFIAFAVYSITGQSKGKSFSGNKASDKVNLINSSNGETDTYQPLNSGQSSEYSRLGGVRRN